ncbi:MAG: hypothetical protein HY519_03480 [Candidatus Aenigmarchaeota archaeon]|nr:hypothetical protein [Candidatus Aenigmarchaeota archaeon]
MSNRIKGSRVYDDRKPAKRHVMNACQRFERMGNGDKEKVLSSMSDADAITMKRKFRLPSPTGRMPKPLTLADRERGIRACVKLRKVLEEGIWQFAEIKPAMMIGTTEDELAGVPVKVEAKGGGKLKNGRRRTARKTRRRMASQLRPQTGHDGKRIIVGSSVQAQGQDDIGPARQQPVLSSAASPLGKVFTCHMTQLVKDEY